MEREFYRPAEIAGLLGVTTNRIYQLCQTGALPSVRFGRSIRIPRQAWQEWLAQQNRAAVSGGHTDS